MIMVFPPALKAPPLPWREGVGGRGACGTDPSPLAPSHKGRGTLLRVEPSCLADERAMPVSQRTIGFAARRRGYQVVIVPRPLALGRRFHLEQEGWREVAAILADRGL